ncbi:hypothetical protein ACWJJH_07190 [Endozoicomonadaceae bacterium StTr2]
MISGSASESSIKKLVTGLLCFALAGFTPLSYSTKTIKPLEINSSKLANIRVKNRFFKYDIIALGTSQVILSGETSIELTTGTLQPATCCSPQKTYTCVTVIHSDPKFRTGAEGYTFQHEPKLLTQSGEEHYEVCYPEDNPEKGRIKVSSHTPEETIFHEETWASTYVPIWLIICSGDPAYFSDYAKRPFLIFDSYYTLSFSAQLNSNQQDTDRSPPLYFELEPSKSAYTADHRKRRLSPYSWKIELKTGFRYEASRVYSAAKQKEISHFKCVHINELSTITLKFGDVKVVWIPCKSGVFAKAHSAAKVTTVPPPIKIHTDAEMTTCFTNPPTPSTPASTSTFKGAPFKRTETNE